MLRNVLLMVASWLTVSTTFAQPTTQLKSTTNDIHYEPISTAATWQSGQYGLLHLSEWLTQEERQALEDAGMRFLDYVPRKSYYVHVPAGQAMLLEQHEKVNGLYAIPATLKLDPTTATLPYPDYALTKKDAIRLQVTVFPDQEPITIKQDLRDQRFTVERQHTLNRVWIVQTTPERLKDLANRPYVQYIELIDEPGEPENHVGRTLHRTNAIHTDYQGGLQYDGSGIKVQMQDDGGIGPHIDYEGRVPKQFSDDFNPNENHGDHVAGTIMGAGNLNPRARGMAAGAELYVYEYDPMNDSIVPHYSEYGIRITSTSYSNGCNRGYSTTARDHDMETRMLPELIHVFSAGNSNGQDCGYGAGNQWGNVTGGHKVGKNVIAVANLNRNDAIANSSSRGPAHDGRIKPDISAQGTDVLSTLPFNNYAEFTGTSMACPGVSGSLAQLYHAYEDLNGHTPPSALMKAVIMNTAEDLGNPGPDYIFGFGRINNLKALETLTGQTYMADTLAQGDSLTFSLNIPSGVVQARVMLYWHDYEATAGAAKALVNDLDFTVTDPNQQLHLPYVLNPFPNPDSLNAPAKPGIDSLNNVEQVELFQPSAGTYTLTVKGKAVPQGPQPFYIVYSYYYPTVDLTYPIGGEGFNPGTAELIRWDALGDTTNFVLEYSLDNGLSWSPITTALGFSRSATWVVPDTASHAKVRITMGNAQDESDTTFSILRTPLNLKVDSACCDSFVLSWDTVPAADAYILYQLGAKYMEPVDTVTTTIARINRPAEQTWYSIAAWKQGGIRSERAIAIPVDPDLKFNCIQPDNATMDAILSPQPGSIPSCDDPVLTVRVSNNSKQTLFNVPVSYRLNGQTFSEIIDSIPALDNRVHTFSGSMDYGTGGTEVLTAWVEQPNDDNNCDDTTTIVNEVQPSNIFSLPYAEDFATFPNCNIDPDCGATNCALRNGWYNEPNGAADDIDWRTDNGGTFSNGTGPVFDYEPGTIFGRYLYTEASGDCNQQEAIMTSPCFDLSGTNAPVLSFYYHMFGPSMGRLDVEILNDGEWVRAFTRIGEQGNDWLNATIDLTNYVDDTVAFRFVGRTGNDYQSDLALDFIQVFDQDPNAIDDPAAAAWDMQLQPNPAQQFVTLQWTGDAPAGTLSVMDLLGRVVYQQAVNPLAQPALTLSTSDWASGQYIVQWQGQQGTRTKSLLIQR